MTTTTKREATPPKNTAEWAKARLRQLDQRLGNGVGATRERKRLTEIIDESRKLKPQTTR